MTLLNQFLKNSFWILVFGLLLGLSLGLQACTQSGSSSSESKPALNLGLSADYPPFEFKKNGEVVGFDVDVARAIAQELGYSLSIQDMDFSALIPSLQSGRIDFVMSGMTVTDERKKNVSFSDSYFTSSFALIVDQKSSISKESDLQGKKIGAQLGTTMEKYAKNKASQYSDMKVVSLGKNPVLIQEIKSGRLDGMVSEEVQASSFVQANPGLRFFPLSGGSTGDGYAIAFSKDPSKNTLIERVNTVLKKLKDSGELNKIKLKWLGQ